MILSKENLNNLEYDLAFFGIGYEERARFVAENITKPKKSFSIGYKKNDKIFHYKKNLIFFEKINSSIVSFDDDNLDEDIDKLIKDIDFTVPVNVLIDITVMSRSRLSILISKISNNLIKGSKLTIKYSISSFIPAPTEVPPVRKIGEISKDFIGEIGDLSLPVSLILGLGYEKDKALGVYHYLDTNQAYCFLPKSPIKKFDDSIIENNYELLNLIDDEKKIHYSVSHPYSTFLDIKSLVIALKKQSRPLLVPLGPKIFAAMCSIIGSEFNLPVWRVASNHQEKPINRPPSGEVVTLGFEV